MRNTSVAIMLACFLAGVGATGVLAQRAKRTPDQLFTRADQNRDGKLTLEEFQGKNKKNAEKKAARFKKLDSDGDGFLSKDEFTAPLRKKASK